MKKLRRKRPPANGIATYWQPPEDDYETWHDKRPADGHWLNAIFAAGIRDTMRDDEDHRLGTTPSYRQAMNRFRASCLARGFDPDTFRMELRRPTQDDRALDARAGR